MLMRFRFLVFSMILILCFSTLGIFVAADYEYAEGEQIISASPMSYSSVKTKQDVKNLNYDMLEDYSAVINLSKEYNEEFKEFKSDLNEFIEESQEDYQERRSRNLTEIDRLNKNIKSNTKKYNNAVAKGDEKNGDYYQSLINADNSALSEVLQIMDDDYDVFMTIKTEVMNQLKAAKKTNRSIKKNRDSSKKVKKRFSRLSNAYLSVKRTKKKSSIKKVVNTANTLNQKLLLLETKCRKQLQYFEEYDDSDDD